MKKKPRDPFLISKTIDGDLPSMKNQRKIVQNRRTRKPMVVKSDKARSYEAYFLTKISKSEAIQYGGPVSLKVRVWYSSRRPDMDIEFLKDLLQKAEIIKNDRQVVHQESWKGISRENPRLIFTLYPCDDPEVE